MILRFAYAVTFWTLLLVGMCSNFYLSPGFALL